MIAENFSMLPIKEVTQLYKAKYNQIKYIQMEQPELYKERMMTYKGHVLTNAVAMFSLNQLCSHSFLKRDVN